MGEDIEAKEVVMSTFEVSMQFNNCTVVRSYVVEANSEDHAREVAGVGKHSCISEEIGSGYREVKDDWVVRKIE